MTDRLTIMLVAVSMFLLTLGGGLALVGYTAEPIDLLWWGIFAAGVGCGFLLARAWYQV